MSRHHKHAKGAKKPKLGQVVVSDSFRRNKVSPTKRQWLTVAGGALFILLVVLALALGGQTEKKKTLPANIDRDYSTTSLKSLPLLLEYDFGLSVEELERANVARLTDTFDEAHNVAIALYRLNKYDKAMEAYAVAEEELPVGAQNVFYAEYFSLAYKKGDISEGDAIYDRAVDRVRNSTLSDDEKQSRLVGLRLGKQAIRDGANR